MREFMKLLIGVSEKAGNLARIIRSDEELFRLLVEEKEEGEKNARFLRDFKTLADVLIQESLRWEVSKMYPEMRDNIFGEESNVFTNANGESVTISIKDTVEETTYLLQRIIGFQENSSSAAKLLAEEVHKQFCANDETVSRIPETGIVASFEDIGVWIDPIDATNEYVAGSGGNIPSSADEFCSKGLPCVTVLIGVFQKSTGQAVAGVINQPFHSFDVQNSRWRGQVHWGLSHPSYFHRSITTSIPNYDSGNRKPFAILSSSESAELVSKLDNNFQCITAAGAGYKLLCAILKKSGVYVLSKGTTHFWDTCGPHSILKAGGGNVISFQDFVSGNRKREINYSITEEGMKVHFANAGGIIAYSDESTLELLRKCLLL